MEENKQYLTEQILTYIGNKRTLLPYMMSPLKFVLGRLNKKKINIFDVFSGSGIVARYFKKYSDTLIVNDLEKYSKVINMCYLSNSNVDRNKIKFYYNDILNKIKNIELVDGIISRLYSPKDEKNISIDDRVFYTKRNAKYIDTIRLLIDKIDKEYRHYFLAPLLVEASIHTNTAGVFKGFYKDKNNGIGKFGGTGENALARICGDIELPFPIFSNFDCNLNILCEDANIVSKNIKNIDLAYIDPPYNQHPYGANYFMLNTIIENKVSNEISKVSGIPKDWERSNYNKKKLASISFNNLISSLDSKFILVSFNSEGFISYDEMLSILNKYGKIIDITSIKYPAYRGSRNLKNRDIHTNEYLYFLEKK